MNDFDKLLEDGDAKRCEAFAGVTLKLSQELLIKLQNKVNKLIHPVDDNATAVYLMLVVMGKATRDLILEQFSESDRHKVVALFIKALHHQFDNYESQGSGP